MTFLLYWFCTILSCPLRLLRNATESFEWFRQHCSLNPPMEQNKAELKEKITEAKLMGDRANQSRYIEVFRILLF